MILQIIYIALSYGHGPSNKLERKKNKELLHLNELTLTRLTCTRRAAVMRLSGESISRFITNVITPLKLEDG